MKRRILASAVAAVGLGVMASASRADYVGPIGTVLLNWGYYNSNYGGEFTATLTYSSGAPAIIPQATPPDDPNLLPAPAGEAVFQTFCIQEGTNDVTFNPGGTYNASVSLQAPLYSGGTETLTSGVQDLFSEFWNGTLTGYNFATNGYTAGTTLSRVESAAALQDAIWVLQGDQSSVGAAAPDAGADSASQTQAQAWLNDVGFAGYNNGAVSLGGNYSNASSVEVLDLQYQNGGPIAQAQLVEIDAAPLPAAASSMIAMLGALALFGWIRKARKVV
jgi:hypothetical protein